MSVYPWIALSLSFLGHSDKVRSISVDPTGAFEMRQYIPYRYMNFSAGQWLASGGDDATARIWEIATGRCMKVYRKSKRRLVQF